MAAASLSSDHGEAIWLAPAKVNLFLHVVGRFDDGYHELQTVFQLIDWYDELQFEKNDTGNISRTGVTEGIPQSEDLTVRAALALRRRCPGSQGVTIGLKKHIPIGSGLGGGSSDAATTLIALNTLWNLNLGLEELNEIAVDLGADVAVFLRGKNAWAEGCGEILSDIALQQRLYLVIVPDVEVSTALVYKECRKSEYYPKIAKERLFQETVGNSLEGPACRLYPEVAKLLEWLRSFGASPRMSGSGGAVFIESDDEAQTQAILSQLSPRYRARVCKAQGGS